MKSTVGIFKSWIDEFSRTFCHTFLHEYPFLTKPKYMKNKTTLTSCWKAAFLPVLFFLGPLEVSAFQPSESAPPFDLSVNKKEQNIINGTITSEEDGQPLPGATILIKGSNAGTVSDLDGNFTITVPDESAILVVSSIGFVQQEIAVGNRTTIHIILQTDMQQLNEVVVVGYGTQKKANITGSIGQIEPENLTERPLLTVDQALVGQIAGVR